MNLASKFDCIFFSQPDRYGRLGHQTFSILTSWLLAKKLGQVFIPIRYAYFADIFNQYVNFSDSEYAVTNLPRGTSLFSIETDDVDKYGNRKFNFDSPEGFGYFLDKLYAVSISKSCNRLIVLPFDQQPGILMRSLGDRDYEDLRRVFKGVLNLATPKDASFYIGFHIRRGDVGSNNHPEWFIDDNICCLLIETLLRLKISDYKLLVFTQGKCILPNLSPKINEACISGKLVIRDGADHFVSQRGEAMTLAEMSQCDIMIGGLSSFSLLASMLSETRLILALIKSKIIPNHRTKSMKIVRIGIDRDFLDEISEFVTQAFLRRRKNL